MACRTARAAGGDTAAHLSGGLFPEGTRHDVVGTAALPDDQVDLRNLVRSVMPGVTEAQTVYIKVSAPHGQMSRVGGTCAPRGN